MIFILRCCKFSRESDRFRKKIPRKQTENWLNISETIWNGKEEGFLLFRAEVQTMREGGREGGRGRGREREQGEEWVCFAVWCFALLLLNCISRPWLALSN
jgi:hypothetical protein